MSKKPSRLEQLGNLLTAMIAVIVSGSSDLMTEPAPQRPKDFKSQGIYWGVFKRVAAEMGVSSTLVRRVHNGTFKSPRIQSALAEEIRRCEERGLMPESQPLTVAELSKFSKGNEYFGVYARVAKQLQINRSTVGDVARGRAVSRNTLTAVRIEMARVDAELAAKNGDAR